MVVLPPSNPSLFPAALVATKGFSNIGPDSHYQHEFSTLALSAPLIFLDPTNSSSCPSCCESFSPFALSLPLSPSVSVANRTVVVRVSDLEHCRPTTNIVTGFARLHTVLAAAGAVAVIAVDESIEPGWMANIEGGGSKQDRRVARASPVPLVSVGAETGGRLIAASSASSQVHVTFTYDENPFQEFYHSYYELPFKLISFLTFASIISRCKHLGVRFSPSPLLSNLPLPILTSTKNIIVILALPVAAVIAIMISLNGASYFDENSKGWIFFSASTMLPSLNLSSSILVARFWSSRRVALAGAAAQDQSADQSAQDPAKTQPVRTLLIVFAGLAADVFVPCFRIFSTRDSHFVLSSIYLLNGLGYLLTTAYFFYSGVRVLRSLSSSNKPLKSMTSYLLAVAVFTLMIMASFTMIGNQSFRLSVEAMFVNSFLYCKQEGRGRLLFCFHFMVPLF